MQLSTVVIASIAIGLVLVYLLEKRKRSPRTPFRSIVYPGAHEPNPMCQNTPVSCETDTDCERTCGDLIAMQCSEQKADRSRRTVSKYCVPAEKPSRPCDLSKGGRWLYTGWGRIDHSIENDWECQCTFPTVAGRIEGAEGCGLNHDVCRGGTWPDGSWEYAAPDPTKCTCPEGTIRIIRDGIKPMCLPKSTICHDEKSCNDNWNK